MHDTPKGPLVSQTHETFHQCRVPYHIKDLKVFQSGECIPTWPFDIIICAFGRQPAFGATIYTISGHNILTHWAEEAISTASPSRQMPNKIIHQPQY
jgi:hypothetical protein